MSKPKRQPQRKAANARKGFSLSSFAFPVIALVIAIGLYWFIPSNKLARVVTPTQGEDVAFDVVDLPGRGKGMIARRKIQRGELILRERPLFVVPPSISTSPTELIASLVASLSPSDREAFFALSHHVSPTDSERLPLSLFETNAIAAGENGVGIFPRTARLNHGCAGSFNVAYNWRQKEGVLVTHALRDIEAGQELLTTYTDTKKPRAERQAYLESNYHFTCGCPTCSLPDAASAESDARLSQLRALQSKFSTWGSGAIQGVEAISIVREMWEIGEKEGYHSERGQLAADATQVSASHSDEDATRAWASLAEEWYGIELGKDSAYAESMRRILRNPRSHWAWGQRRAMTVGGP